jgi:hypothetical protein
MQVCLLLFYSLLFIGKTIGIAGDEPDCGKWRKHSTIKTIFPEAVVEDFPRATALPPVLS